MPNEFRDRRVAELYRWWSAKCVSRLAPRQDECDIAEIPALRPIAHLIDVIEDPLRFRHRWIGSEVVHWMRRDASGQFIDAALYGDAAEEIHASLAIVTREVRPYRRRARMVWRDERGVTIESIEMPLLDEYGTVTAILRGASFFLDREKAPRRLDFRPLSRVTAPFAAPG
ncbi:MAG: PAS domain-containing protein [Alphaproteobacteria bacterium]|nr:PAS domain-containing protein [Alphaproteobacteria bacterium]